MLSWQLLQRGLDDNNRINYGMRIRERMSDIFMLIGKLTNGRRLLRSTSYSSTSLMRGPPFSSNAIRPLKSF